MLEQVAGGVFVHTSDFLQSNTVIVQGESGVLLVDPGITRSEMFCLTADLDELGQHVVAGFSTHPHWDHLLWDARFGPVPRYGTARCAATVRARLSAPDALTRVLAMMPPDIADQVGLDLLGDIVGLPDDAGFLPWDGPPVRIIEHRAHAPGHAALLIEDSGALVAGDMLSDVLVPMLDPTDPDDPVGSYLAALERIDAATGSSTVVIPGHGSVGDAHELGARIARDRKYVEAARDRVEEPGSPG